MKKKVKIYVFLVPIIMLGFFGIFADVQALIATPPGDYENTDPFGIYGGDDWEFGESSGISPNSVSQVMTGQIPFGGRIVKVIPCLASGNFMITHVPAAGSPVVMFQPGASRLYSYFQLTPGNWMLGNTLGMVPCLQLVPFPPFVIPLGVYPLITIVGTSGTGMTAGSGANTSGSDDGAGGGQGGSGGTGGGNTVPAVYEPVEPCGEGDNTTSSYIIANEGWRNSPYTDSRGYRTVGVGHRITGNEPFDVNRTLTNQEVATLYEMDYNRAKEEAAMAAAAHNVDFDSLSDTRQAVLTDMAFNMGAQGGGGLAGFDNMWSAVANNDWDRAGYEITHSRYGSQLPARSARNAEAMRTDDRSVLDRHINSDPQAWQFCQPVSEPAIVA